MRSPRPYRNNHDSHSSQYSFTIKYACTCISFFHFFLISISQVESSLGGVTSPITMAAVQPPSPCYNSEPFLELPVKRQADTLRVTLSKSRNGHYHSLSEIEIYVDESHIFSRYLYTPLFSRTVIFAVLAKCGNSRGVNFAILLMLSLV